jgi:PAS domain S-box-containing protein
VILITSITIRVLALVWSVVLLRRLRDWRMAFVSVMLALMAMRQTLTLTQGAAGPGVSVTTYTTELPGLLVSVMAVLSVFFVGRMIVRREQAEDALRQSEERYRRLVDHSLGLICTHDLDGVLLSVNPAGAAALGYQPADLVGKPLAACLPESVHERIDVYLDEIRRQSTSSGVVRVLTREGKERLWLYRNVLYSERGQPRYVLGHAQDITDRTRAEGALLTSQKMEALGTLAGGIAHDFNNILAAIVGYTQLAVPALAPESVSGQHLREVLQAAERARALIERIQLFSRPQEPGHHPVELRGVVDDVLRLVHPSLPSSVQTRKRFGASASVVRGDAIQLHQMVINLCTNAGQAMAERGGVLQVALDDVEVGGQGRSEQRELPHGRYLRLRVSDTGHGLMADTVHRIFEPFFTTRTDRGGTGMGLAMVHGIVRSHGGVIAVDSQPGQGTTFSVYLPASDLAVPALPPVADLPSPGKERILVVDDDPVLARMHQQMLESLGYDAAARTSARDAFEAFRAASEAFDAVLLDQAMPEIAGDVLAAELMKIHPGIRIVLCTGFSNALTPERASALGIREYLSKPVRLEDLAVALRRALDASTAS